MADALTGIGLVKDAFPIVVGKLDKYVGMHLVYGMALSVYEDSGDLAFNAFVTEQDTATSAITYKVLSNIVANTSWTDLYTPASGKMAFVSLWVSNIGETSGAYSFGIRGATEVAGETPPG